MAKATLEIPAKKKDIVTIIVNSRDNGKIYEKDGIVYYECKISDGYFSCMRIDLTRAFGKGNEPKTIEEFNKLYPQFMKYVDD